MGEKTQIAWCDHTFNPWIGCTKISPGCANCYAEKSLPVKFNAIEWGKGKLRHRTSNANWKKPITWHNKAVKSGVRKRVFCASLADVFDPEIDQKWRDDLWALIEQCDGLDWQLLTKRLNNLNIDEMLNMLPMKWRVFGFPEHVWLGHSVCTQSEADRIIPMMVEFSARVRFLSIEPLLEKIDLVKSIGDLEECFHWVIIGGESGEKARNIYFEWIENLLADCSYLKIASFVKQLGSNLESNRMQYPYTINTITDRKGGDITEWPANLAVRQFPKS